jgi:hypothetical protein
MSNKTKAMQGSTFLRSFADLPRDTIVQAIKHEEQRHFVPWSAEGMMLTTLSKATATLQEWLTARFAELVREKVPMDEVIVVMNGARTVIKVHGIERFSFKMKCSVEGT